MTLSQSKTQELYYVDIGRPSLKTLERESFTECWLTVLPRLDLEPADACRELFISVASLLLTNGIQPIQEKVYGSAASFNEIKSARLSTFVKAGLPADLPAPTFLECPPVGPGNLAGVQIWGIKAKSGGPVHLETISVAGLPSGCSIKGPGFQMIYLPSVCGSGEDGKLPPTITGQAEAMFARAEAGLEACGMTFLDVARTWIYLSRILHWYGEFNRVRSKFFKERSIGLEDKGHAFPASTGIQGRSGVEECLMDVLAVKPETGGAVSVRPLLHSCRQDRAFKYGSAFSRGISVFIEGKQTVYVSGTASIGPDGATRYLGEVEAQIMETLLSIAALLESAGGGLKDVTSATLFCKEASSYQKFKEITHLLGVAEFPVVPVVADVCRSDLLVEIEAVAAIAGDPNKLHAGGSSSTGGAGKEGSKS
jgi:enamine deaminase RidA (YjgF/YER057c/UK114 family)